VSDVRGLGAGGDQAMRLAQKIWALRQGCGRGGGRGSGHLRKTSRPGNCGLPEDRES